MANPYSVLLKVTFVFIIISSELCGGSKNFTIVNYCKETIWPGITQSTENLSGDGFTLKPGQSTVYTAPVGWSGRIWARTGCNFDRNGNGKCQIGGCGTNNINCTDPGTPPATIAEFILGVPDYYDVSLVDGFNLPLTVKAVNGIGNCSMVGCDVDLRKSCPSKLEVKENGKVIACKSACEVFNTDEYCCRGVFGNPDKCMPSNYSKGFKKVCPTTYSYAYDDPTSIVTCSEADFIVTFCGSMNQTVMNGSNAYEAIPIQRCYYHDNELVCVGSNAYRAIPPQRWWVLLMLPLIYMFNFRIMS